MLTWLAWHEANTEARESKAEDEAKKFFEAEATMQGGDGRGGGTN